MSIYLNEHDPQAAAWLRQLMADGHIPAGVVDERDIQTVDANELRDFRQVHLFAGIGGWPLALRLAGWPDDRPVWTGSCPCQPFSSAGKRKGKDDARHLWPDMRRLVAECRPPIVFGEQVASNDGRLWLAGVRADLEGLAYAVGAADLCAAGAGTEGEGWFVRGGRLVRERIVVSAPHIRQRLFWGARRLADAADVRRGQREHGRGMDGTATKASGRERVELPDRFGGLRSVGRLADNTGRGCGAGSVFAGRPDGEGRARPTDDCGMGFAGRAGDERGLRHRQAPCPAGSAQGEAQQRERGGADVGGDGSTGRLGDLFVPRLEGHAGDVDHGHQPRRDGTDAARHAPATGGSGFWRDADVLPCRDGKARRVEPGTFPLAHGVPGRVGLLRGYGNAIVPPLAATFVTAFLESIEDERLTPS